MNSLLHQTTIGIDISDYKLRLLALRTSYHKPQIYGFNEIDLTAGIMVNGTIQQPEQFVTALRQLMKHHAVLLLQNPAIHVGVPEQQSFITAIPLRSGDKTTLTNDALSTIPFEPTEMYYDIQILKATRTIEIAAGRKQFIDDYLKLLDQADVRPVGLHVEVQGLANALLKSPTLSSGKIIIDLGLARTTVVFSLHNSIYFTTTYPSVLKSGSMIHEDHLQNVLKQIMSFYEEHYQKIDTLAEYILCGSGAYEPDVAKFISTITGLNAHLGNPFQAIHQNHISKKITHPLAYTTAIGLALAQL